MTAHRLPPSVLALTTGVEEQRCFAAVARAVEAGLEGVLVREPSWSDRALLALCVRLRALSSSLWIGIHDRVGPALAETVDAVHLGFRSLSPAHVRAMLPESKAVGFSAHAGDEAGARDGADYLFFGPVHDTPSKRGVVEPVGLTGLGAECAREARPIWALGGVSAERAPECFDAGAKGIACLSGLLGAADPAEAMRAYQRTTEALR